MKIILILLLGLINGLSAALASDNDVTGVAHLIVNNTTRAGGIGVMTNLNTSEDCSRQAALYGASCNAFSLAGNELQVIQSDSQGNLINQIGVTNSDATSYDNKGTDNQLNYFAPDEHLFDIDKYRNAADQIAQKSVGLPLGTYGTISFEQFIHNVANARPMYGIVRVKVPLVKNTTVTTESDDDSKHMEKDDDGHSDDDADKHDSSKESDDDDSKHSKNKYKMCGETPTPECMLCGPGQNTRIIPGNSVCGVKIGMQAKIQVYGSLMFDWVDCKTEQPIPLADMPSSPRDLYFMVDVPINVNPANPEPVNGTMSTLPQIPNIIGNNRCPGGTPCSLPVNNTIPYSLVSSESKEQFQYETGSQLSEARFNQLTQAEKYSLLFPSGYEKGLANAFSTLGITHDYWNALGFKTPGGAGFIDINQIRSDAFEDIPVYMYTGGLVDMHHHVNISGLVYVPQAMELEQIGLTVAATEEHDKECKTHSDDDDSKVDDSHNMESDDGMHTKSSSDMESDDSSTEKSDDDSSCESDDDSHSSDDGSKHAESDDDGCCEGCAGCGGKDTTTEEVFIPSWQYINGAIMVRDSFYIKARKPGGITVLNNNPNTYSQIELSSSSARGGTFQAYPVSSQTGTNSGGDTGGSNGGSTGGSTGSGSGSGGSGSGGDDAGNNGQQQGINPGSQWIEIRPQ